MSEEVEELFNRMLNFVKSSTSEALNGSGNNWDLDNIADFHKVIKTKFNSGHEITITLKIEEV